MAFSQKQKKTLFPLILLFVLTAALLFFFRPRTFDLSQAHTLVIQSGTTGEKVEITNPQKIARIADQFVSLRFYRKTKAHSAGWSYSLSWYDAQGNEQGSLTILSPGEALWKDHYYTVRGGVVDTGLLEEWMEIN